MKSIYNLPDQTKGTGNGPGQLEPQVTLSKNIHITKISSSTLFTVLATEKKGRKASVSGHINT